MRRRRKKMKSSKKHINMKSSNNEMLFSLFRSTGVF